MRWLGIGAVLALLAGCAGGGTIPVLEEPAPAPAAPAGCAQVDAEVVATLASGLSSLTLLTTPQGVEALRQESFAFDHTAYRAALAQTQFVEVTGFQDEGAGAAIAALTDAAERAGRIIDAGVPTHDDLVEFAEATGGPGVLADHHQRLGDALSRACAGSLG
ncbi:hypothetical protein [Demequina sp. NBRC 110055]|uniref:hypothetical protein n=1 Tax=Demequina sp. NBRC 110055 TaxID=1570344 RepID=UPI001185CBDF|nr:hypothetical protein [Demequina sp. NBRC 110055]